MFSCTPPVFLELDADTIRLMEIYHRGQPRQQQTAAEGGEWDA